MSEEPLVTLPPRMPHSWLEQLAKAMRPRAWPSILGSAVVAALIGWGSSYFTARMMIDANLRLEQAKADLQLEQEKIRNRGAVYGKLATSLDDLHKHYRAYLNLIPIASGSVLSDQLLEVGKAVRSVEIAKSDPILLKSAITMDVDACLLELNPVIFKAQTDPKSALIHQNIDSKLEELAYKAQQEGQQFNLVSH